MSLTVRPSNHSPSCFGTPDELKKKSRNYCITTAALGLITLCCASLALSFYGMSSHPSLMQLGFGIAPTLGTLVFTFCAYGFAATTLIAGSLAAIQRILANVLATR